MINNHCYDFKLIQNNKGILDNFVDATYILTLVGSERQKNIYEQLELYTPTKKIFIVNNKGYKKCNKTLIKNIPPYDLTDAYFNTINHSLKNNYNNILILEDDFIFSQKIKDSIIINEIDTFFSRNTEKIFYYNLGPIPILFYPNINIFNNTFRGIHCTSSHAIIYTKKIQIDIINRKNKNIIHWDTFLMKTYLNYFYKYPLCYQLFPITENQKYWYSINQGSIFHTICNNTIVNINKILELNKKSQPGFNIVYNISFFFNYLILFILLIILLILILNIFKLNKKNIVNKKIIKYKK